MPRNGSGVYSLPSGINPVVTQTLITSSWANTTMTDIATALTNSLAKDGQTTMTGNLNMGGFQVIGLGPPTQGNSAVSLSYVQSGAQFRLTNVSGSANQITATLPGGSTAFTIGQLVELIPATNNNGAVTMNVNGVGYVPIVSGIGSALAKNSLLAGTIYLLVWDGAQWRILMSPNASAFAQAATSGWDRPAPGPNYPDITKVNANTVAVPAGAGRIVAPGARDLAGVTEVSWVAQNVVLTNILNAWCTTLAIDNTGTAVQLVGPIQSQWYRQYIVLGVVAHIDGQIDGIVQQPAVFGDAGYTALDLGTLFHNTITAGGQVIPSANTLHMDVKAGRMWLQGGNSDNPNQTNFVDFPDQLNITFYPVTANNTVAVATQAAPITQYDPGGLGALANIPVPTTQAVIHRLYLLAGQYVWCFGQTLYPDLNTAIQSINNDNATFKPPGKLQGATLFAYVCANAVCTNLNDGVGGRLVAANAVSATAGGGGGGGVSEAPIDGNCYARLNAAWWRTIYTDVNYNGMLGSNGRAMDLSFALNSSAGYNRTQYFQSAGINRWSFNINAQAEAGSNAGSDFTLNRYADNGAFINNSIGINRASGQINMADGLLLVGADNLALPGRVWIDAAAGQQKKVQFQNAGKARWEIGSNADAETGANAGSSFYINRFDDTGATIDQPFWIDRKLGKITYTLTAGAQPNFTITGNGAQPIIQIDVAQSGMARFLAGTNQGKNRWYITLGDNAAESGSNAGSNFSISRASDTGALIDAPMSINRATGNVTFSQAVYATGPITTSQYFVANQNFVSSTNAAVLTTSGAGTIYLRPQGLGSSVNQAVLDSNGVLALNGSASVYNLVITNTATATGAGFWLNGNGASNPNKLIRVSSGQLQIVNSANSAILWTLSDYGSNAAMGLTGGFYPASDNAYQIGQAGGRWTVIYAVSGTINTCDVREKDVLGPNALGLDFVNAIPVSHFKYKVGYNLSEPLNDENDEPILDENGQFQTKTTPVAGTRTHISGMAQDVYTQLQAAGLDPSAMGIWSLDDPTDPNSRQGLRTEQLLWVLWTAVQQLSAQVKALQPPTP